jgi:long-chain acyl-CoA synthetase
MISPARLEGYLTTEPEIFQAMVFGDRRPYLVAILVPDPDFVAGFAPQNSGDMPPIAGEPRFTQAIGTAVARVNELLSPCGRVRRFLIADEPFTIANGLMTPTLKIRRNAIRETYCAALNALYQRAHAAD